MPLRRWVGRCVWEHARRVLVGAGGITAAAERFGAGNLPFFQRPENVVVAVCGCQSADAEFGIDPGIRWALGDAKAGTVSKPMEKNFFMVISLMGYCDMFVRSDSRLEIAFRLDI